MKHAEGGFPAVVVGARVNAGDLVRARRLRRHGTEAERRAWSIVRNRGLLGLKFRRQQCVCGFVVDLYCASLRLAIEPDGGAHDDPEQRSFDCGRDEILARNGISTMRIRNQDVNAEKLRSRLQEFLADRR